MSSDDSQDIMQGLTGSDDFKTPNPDNRLSVRDNEEYFNDN